LVIGELDLILGNIEGTKSFEDLLREAWEASRSNGDLRERINQLGTLLNQARQQYEQVRQSNQVLDDALDR